MAGWLRWTGFLFLSMGFVAAAVLSVAHWGNFAPLGCGTAGSCENAATSRWGSVAGWPTSHLGLAWFGALFVAWAAAVRSGVSPGLVHASRFGVLVALTLLAAMVGERIWCPYCMAAHAAGFGFWIIAEISFRRRKARSTSFRPLVAYAGLSLLLGSVEWTHSTWRLNQTERTVHESIARLSTAQGFNSDGPGFTGRYRLGPELALARLVIFSDYQCTPCRRVEEEVRELLKARSDVSLSVRHYPLCRDCNQAVKQTIHPQACSAARAAEAAGMMLGNAGFFEMHSWLFQHGGIFTDAELTSKLHELGLDESEVRRFFTTMNGEETLRRVQADAQEGAALELKVTPLVFINGLDFPGWHGPKAITRAVQALADQKALPRTAAADHPATGAARDVQHWLAEAVKAMPDGRDAFSQGPTNAPIRAVLFGSYRGNLSAQMERLLSAALKGRNDVRVEFHPFPMAVACNPSLQRDAYPGDCHLVSLAVAAGSVGGPEAFWKLHRWLLSHPQSGRPEADAGIRSAVDELGINADALFLASEAPETQAAIAFEVSAAKTVEVMSAPTLFIQGRPVKEWSKAGMIEAILHSLTTK